MRRSIVLVFVVSIVISGLAGCDGKFYPDIPPIYDPAQAGATIVESFNITGQIEFFNNSYRDEQFFGYYAIALYGDNIYVHTNGEVLYVFEKDNFTKTGEINLSIKSQGQVFILLGLAIIGEGHGFLLHHTSNPYNIYLLSLDLNTGATEEIEGLEKTGMEPNSRIYEIGFDKENGLVWFCTTPPNRLDADTIYFFEYNSLEGIFSLKTKIEPKRPKFYRNPHKIFISGDNLFRTGYTPSSSSQPGLNKLTYYGVEKYRITNPEEKLYSINAKYLGTKTIPNNIIYDEPYIWMMVEKDNQIQMLKLLPNE